MYSPTMTDARPLKKDLFREIRLVAAVDEQHNIRDAGPASD